MPIPIDFGQTGFRVQHVTANILSYININVNVTLNIIFQGISFDIKGEGLADSGKRFTKLL